jgi:bifunctional DNA-binding transcriptional regulator/antitoxin component of YhaV-PrlF toxin-antitoxin module
MAAQVGLAFMPLASRMIRRRRGYGGTGDTGTRRDKQKLPKVLEIGALRRDIPSMHATVIDKKRRMTLPESVCQAVGLKPHDQVEWRAEAGEIRGRRLVAQKPKEAFPPGSLLQYFTPERDKEELAILSGCVKGPE